MVISGKRPCLRQRQLLATRETIRRAALDLATERGSTTVSVQDISAAAGVSPRTFFNHFRTKDEALVPDLPDFTDEQRRTFLEATDIDLLTALERLLADHVADVLDLAGPGGALYAGARLSHAHPELLPRTLAVFETFKHRVTHLVAERTGRSTDDLACSVAAGAALGTVRTAIVRWSRCAEDPPDASYPDLPTTITDAFDALRDLARHDATTS